MYMYALINGNSTYACYFSIPSLPDEDVVYLIESVVRGHHISKRVRSPTVCEVLQLTRKDRNDDHFAACLRIS